MINGTTKSGFKFELKEELADDFELLEILCAVDENPAKVVVLAAKLLGEDQESALKEHLRGDNGIVKVSDMVRDITEIIEAFPKSKN